MITPSPTRINFLDSLRVIAILFVFFFHCARFFDLEEWHVKNAETSKYATIFVIALVMWIMPLFFFISGASTWFAFRKKSGGQFISDRVKRIFIPLAFGTVVIALPQVYLERVSHGDYAGSLASFIPLYFDGWYGFGGNFAWMGLHLWYLLLLFFFSLVLIPVFLLLRKKLPAPGLQKFLSGPLPFILLPILTFIPGFFIHYDSFPGMRVWGGWTIVEHSIFLLVGFVCFSGMEFTENCRRNKGILMTIGLLATALMVYFFLADLQADWGSSFFALKVLIRATASWMLIAGITGYSAEYLNNTNRRWSYSAEAVLPFYILHQTIIIILGYYIVQWNMNMILKYVLIAILSLTSILLIYELIVRRHNAIRWLFGMPARKNNIEAK